jgi:uncharacterized cofD-like protein
MLVIPEKIKEISNIKLSPLDLLPQAELREKIVALILQGVPENAHRSARAHLHDLRRKLLEPHLDGVEVVVFGGGTGLSNIIGGDSRLANWTSKPFSGLKEIFPQTRSIVCITDNGGSTGELLKDLPLMAIGDMRHVLLSSTQRANLQKKYNLTGEEAKGVASQLAAIFNWRYNGPLTRGELEQSGLSEKIRLLPNSLQNYLLFLIDYLFSDRRLSETLQRPHCFGNLLTVAAIYRETEAEDDNFTLAAKPDRLHEAVQKGMHTLGVVIGAGNRAVRPCTSTPAQLRIRYTNGVEIVGEHKLSRASRGFPVESVSVDYVDKVQVYSGVLADIARADIVIFAPGSLYSSIIPVFQVPGLAEAVRSNQHALKVLVSNLWVQSGETDLSIIDPERKFHVSDMIRAYEKNIPGGTKGLFNEVICISLQDVPASVLQRYAVEGKIPIYLDRQVLSKEGYLPIECGIYSRMALAERGVIQHDPDTLAVAIQALYVARNCFTADVRPESSSRSFPLDTYQGNRSPILPCQRYLELSRKIKKLRIAAGREDGEAEAQNLRERLEEILWDHPLIPLGHLDYCRGVHLVDRERWHRDQQWDNVFSFYDPADGLIKIRSDQLESDKRLEVAFLIALGESLLGNYAAKKVMDQVDLNGLDAGRVYHLHICPENDRICFFSQDQLRRFLLLARMADTVRDNHFIRLINKGEGFTPPGLLMGLTYAWYLDNRFATHIEYKMSVMRINQTDLIPEQLKMVERRRKMVDFFREVVFSAQPKTNAR